MSKIVLDLSNDLKTNSNKELTISISSEPGNTLEIKDDGLYAMTKKGMDGSGGTGYTNSTDYIRIGYEGPYGNTKAQNRVSCTNVIHRLFEGSIDGNGYVTLKDFRQVDCVLAGDMFRVPVEDSKYNYYLITDTIPTLNGLDNYIKPNCFVQLGSEAW